MDNPLNPNFSGDHPVSTIHFRDNGAPGKPWGSADTAYNAPSYPNEEMSFTEATRGNFNDINDLIRDFDLQGHPAIQHYRGALSSDRFSKAFKRVFTMWLTMDATVEYPIWAEQGGVSKPNSAGGKVAMLATKFVRFFKTAPWIREVANDRNQLKSLRSNYRSQFMRHAVIELVVDFPRVQATILPTEAQTGTREWQRYFEALCDTARIVQLSSKHAETLIQLFVTGTPELGPTGEYLFSSFKVDDLGHLGIPFPEQLSSPSALLQPNTGFLGLTGMEMTSLLLLTPKFWDWVANTPAIRWLCLASIESKRLDLADSISGLSAGKFFGRATEEATAFLQQFDKTDNSPTRTGDLNLMQKYKYCMNQDGDRSLCKVFKALSEAPSPSELSRKLVSDLVAYAKSCETEDTYFWGRLRQNVSTLLIRVMSPEERIWIYSKLISSNTLWREGFALPNVAYAFDELGETGKAIAVAFLTTWTGVPQNFSGEGIAPDSLGCKIQTTGFLDRLILEHALENIDQSRSKKYVPKKERSKKIPTEELKSYFLARLRESFLFEPEPNLQVDPCSESYKGHTFPNNTCTFFVDPEIVRSNFEEKIALAPSSFRKRVNQLGHVDKNLNLGAQLSRFKGRVAGGKFRGVQTIDDSIYLLEFCCRHRKELNCTNGFLKNRIEISGLLLRAFLGVFENAFGDTISELHKLNPGVIKLGENEHLSVLVREISLDYLKRFSDRIETVGNLVNKMNSPRLLFQYDEMFRSKYYTLAGHYSDDLIATDKTNGQSVTQLQRQHFQARFYTQFDTHLCSLILSDKVMDIHLDAVLDRGLEILPEEHLHIQLVEQADDLEVLALQKSGHKWECFSHSIGVKPALRHVKEIKAYLASSDTSSESAEEFTEACIELGKLILEPVLAWAKFSSDGADSCPTLSICESDSINSVPWHALPLGTGMAIEKFNISVYPSFRYMVHCNFEPPEVSGDLEFIHIHGGDSSGLGSVEDESKTLSGIHSRYLHVSRGLQLDEDGSASPRGAINGENILHFSCHGIFNGEDPFQSYFDLGNGENIFAHELQQDSLAETSLVFLNCCDSGYVEFKPGKDPVGLSRPFLSNGVQNVVSTLWPVRDSFSADFAGRFYRNLETEKTVSALRKTQLEFLAKDRNPELMRDWACYSICGVY